MNHLVAFWTIVRKEISRFIRIWGQTLLPPVITSVLYFIIFGGLIGSQVREIAGFSYMAFIAPGLIMMMVITNSYANVVASFFISKFQRSVEELLVSPIGNHVIIWGYTIGGVARGLVVGVLVSLTAMFFTKLPINNIFMILVYVLLASILFSLAGLINGIYAKKFDDISIIPTFVLTPLTYLGGVFYSIALLPEMWQTVSKLNPIIYIVNGFRFGFLGVSDVGVGFGLLMTVLFIAVLYAWTYYLLKKGVGLKS